MSFGKNAGEVAYAGFVAGASGTASLAGHPFNVLGVSLVSVGLFAVTLTDPVDPTDEAITANSPTVGALINPNNGGANTDSVKFFTASVSASANTLISASGFYFVGVRTNVP